MNFPTDQIEELKRIYPNVKLAEEMGCTYFFLPDLDMPSGCQPGKVDALFCPTLRDGYNTSLFLSQKITGCPTRNWNREVKILDRTWYAISWNFSADRRLVQSIRTHIDAFRNET